MKKYDTYKDSGIEWIGEIPEGWNCKRFIGRPHQNITNNFNMLFWSYGKLRRFICIST